MFKINLGGNRGSSEDDYYMRACDLEKNPEDNIVKLKVLTERLRIADHMRYHLGGSEWIEVKTVTGRAFMRGLLKEETIAVTDNYASPGTKYPVHQHPGSETFIVYNGVMNLDVDGEKITVNTNGKPYYFDARKRHTATFDVETEFIAVTIPADHDWPKGG